jgi:ABC-type tungstate transport system substrate-binding protein
MIAIVYDELCAVMKFVVSNFSKCISEAGGTMKRSFCENAMSCGNMIAIVYNELCVVMKIVIFDFSECISEVGDTMKRGFCENAAMSCR